MYLSNLKISTAIIFLLVNYHCVWAGTIHLPKQNFHESYVNEVNISGAVRAGVMFESNARKVNLENLFIDVGDHSDLELEVKLISICGRYEAKFKYKLDKTTRGWTRFNLPTDMANIISGFNPEQLVVLAKIRGGSSKSIIVPASWGKPATNRLKVFLNSGVSSTTLKLYGSNGNSDKIKCREIKNKTNIAYDTVCSVKDIGQYRMSKTKIIRRNYDNFFKPVRLPISNEVQEPL